MNECNKFIVEKNGIQFYSFGTHSLEEIESCQNRLLKMATVVTNILETNKFQYCISYGTLLGAVRHGGFIPWDEDFDINLFEDDYDEAVKCLRDNLPKEYIVHDKNSDVIYWPEWSKVRDVNTEASSVFFSDDDYYRWTGLNIDLYKYEKIKAKDILTWKKKKSIEYLVRKHDSKVMPDEEYNMLFDKWISEYLTLLNANVDGNQEYVYAMIDTSKDATYKINDFFPLKKIKFEGYEFFAPNNYDGVLSSFYGDYMNLPPLNKRTASYSKVYMRL